LITGLAGGRAGITRPEAAAALYMTAAMYLKAVARNPILWRPDATKAEAICHGLSGSRLMLIIAA
ncbi:unnamed protein product, partial [marine sediment metagenome]